MPDVELHTCQECTWTVEQGPHIGCFPNGKWRQWISKKVATTPQGCRYFKLKIMTIPQLMEMQHIIMEKVPDPHWDVNMQHILTCAFGLIEETMEYINSIGRKPWRPTVLPKEKQLEELSDILHFYLEIIIRSGFTWQEVVEAYPKKHAENLERYLKASKGDLSWDDRATKEEL